MTKYTIWNAIGHVHDKKMIMYTKYTAYRPLGVWSEQSILLDLYTIQTFLVTQVECPHFKTLRSVIFGTVSQQFIHTLFRNSTKSFLQITSTECREHIQDYERSGHDAVVSDLALHNAMVGGTIFRMRI